MRVGRDFVLDAVREFGGPDLTANRAAVLESATNPPIENADTIVEVVVATSGKALLLVRKREIGEQIIERVTLRAITHVPGIQVRGSIVEFDWAANSSFAVAQTKAIRELEQLRSEWPGTNQRFQRLPMVQECASSGLPASTFGTLGDGRPQPISLVVKAKRTAAEAGANRMRKVLEENGIRDLRFPRNTTELEEWAPENWLAIVHIDGNGIGQLLQNLYEANTRNRDIVDILRRFSTALEKATERAFCKAVVEVAPPIPKRNQEPVRLVPLVLGGDDVTVACDGRLALDFATQMVLHFEKETGDDPFLAGLVSGMQSQPWLSTCAGVAVVSSHYPFHAAYELAEALLQSAKAMLARRFADSPDGKRIPCSALDFHLLYDSSGGELNAIRRRLERLESDGTRTRFTARPIIVSPIDKLPEEAQEWVERRHWNRLQNSVRVLLATDEDGRRCLPNSLIHDWRAAVLQGRPSADSVLQLARQHDIDLNPLLGTADSLFWQDESGEFVTRLLDAMDAAELNRGGLT